MKTVFVTGHLGLLGSAILRALTGRYRVITTSLDLREEWDLRAFFAQYRPNYVINCAAKVGGVKANRDLPVDFLRDNLAIQSSVINACHQFDVERLVSIGTSCLFPKDAPLPVCEDSLLTGPFDPSVQAYAIAKLAGYALCKAYHDQHGRNYMTACPSNLYGKGDNYGPSAHVVPALMSRMLDCLKTGEPLTVWGDGSAVREFLYADDAAEAIITVMENWNRPDAINVGTGQGITIRELVRTLIEITGAKVEVIWDKSQPTGIQNKTFNICKLSALGWEASTDLQQGLTSTWHDFIENPHPRRK